MKVPGSHFPKVLLASAVSFVLAAKAEVILSGGLFWRLCWKEKNSARGDARFGAKAAPSDGKTL